MIHAERLIPPPGPRLADEPDLYSDERDGVLLRLFGMLPDYADPRLEHIWQELNRRPWREIAQLCRHKGVEVLKANGATISCALDIATLLVAAERGLLAAHIDPHDGEE